MIANISGYMVLHAYIVLVMNAVYVFALYICIHHHYACERMSRCMSLHMCLGGMRWYMHAFMCECVFINVCDRMCVCVLIGSACLSTSQ